MVWPIAMLIILSFLQGAVLPVNLVLIILLCRSFITSDRSNFYLAFAFGLLISFLSGSLLGGLSLAYLLTVLLAQIIKKVHLFAHWTVMIPVSAVALIFNQAISGLLLGASLTSSINFSVVAAEMVLLLPVYFLVLFWEERFVPKSDFRLKIR